MTAIANTPARTTNVFAKALDRVSFFFATIRKAQEFDSLYRMTDGELAARGIDREQLVKTYFLEK